MSKTLIFNIVLLVLISCQEHKNKTVIADASIFEISTEKWPKKSTLSAMTIETSKEWSEFNALESSFDAVYSISNTEDLELVLEDLIKKNKLVQDANYPELFNKAQIKSRQKVFHTFILKTKGDLIYRVDVQQSILKMIAAHNAMLDQMNVISGTDFDLDALLKGE